MSFSIKVTRSAAALGSLFLCCGSLAAQAAPVTLNLWDHEEEQNAKVMDGWFQKFMAANPDIKIVRQTYPNEDLRQKFITAATAGKAAQLIWVANDLTGVFSTAKLVQPVESYMNLADFAPSAVEPGRVNGKIYGIPMNYGNHLMLMYNKSLVKNAPKDTAELIKIGKEFTKPEEKKYGLVMNQMEPFWFVPIMGAFGAWPLVDSGDKVTITLKSEGNRKALQWLKDLKYTHKITPRECDYDCAKGLFLEGKAPFTVNGDWAVKEFKQKMGANLGLAPLPIVTETGKPMNPLLGGKYLLVNNKVNSAEKEAIKKFVNFMVSDEIQVDTAMQMGRIPVTKKAQKNPKVLANEDVKAFTEAAIHGKPMPPQVEMRACWDAMRPVLQKVMTDKLKPEEAATEMQKSAEAKLKALKQ